MFRALAVTIALLCAAVSYAEPVTVSAAISLKESLVAIAKDYEASTGEKVEFNFGASGQLMLQIQQGAPVDAFISAAARQVDQLQKDGLLAAVPQRIVVRNHLVLIAPANQKIGDGFQGLSSAAVHRIAIGQPRTVPAGEYGMQVLEKLGISQSVKDRLIFGANVRQVLDYVIRGEVDAGIVYSSDACEAGDRVTVAAVAQDGWHQAIVYPAVVIKASAKQEAAERFLRYLMTEKAQAVFAGRGFAPGDRESGK